MRSDTKSQTTAYASNTRHANPARDVKYSRNAKIQRLLKLDYAFLPLNFQLPGFLFRGLESGLNVALSSGRFGLNQGSHSLAHLERDLEVLLISGDFSDAFTVSRIWENNEDAVILALKADYFKSRYEQDRAATLGFAEPGVVFKYPFLCDDIALADVSYFICSGENAEKIAAALRQACDTPHAIDNDRFIFTDSLPTTCTRQTLNEYLAQRFRERNITGATAVQVDYSPTKDGSASAAD